PSSCARPLSSSPWKPISRSMPWMRRSTDKSRPTSTSESPNRDSFPIYRGGSMNPAKLFAGMTLLCAATSPAPAQDYPSRFILFVVPFTPGTTADSLARLMQTHISQRWGVPVVVENRPGAAGIIGIDSVAKANPDGYTYLFTSTAFGTLAAMNPKLPYDPNKSFA